jgi:UDPglucose 6-dehydrogenase
MAPLSIGIIGGGYVGSATALFQSSPVINVLIYDIDPTKRRPAEITLQDIVTCDLIFICVPTPSRPNGACDSSIVESVVSQLYALDPSLNQIIVRSTVPPGTCQRLGTHFMPEFLTEKNWRDDFIHRDTWIFGLNPDKNPTVIHERCQRLIELAYQMDRIRSMVTRFVTSQEAECAKYVRNCFLTCKVAFFNEIYDYCDTVGLNYATIRELTIEDSRIGESHTQVPGNNGQFGFGGTCFPKDLAALIEEFKSHQVIPSILQAAQERNQRDRQRPPK